jgi:tetratricopeptide (TPR) repeat protein
MQHGKLREKRQTQPQPAKTGQNDHPQTDRHESESGSRMQRIYVDARRCMDAGDYEKARQILNAGGSSDDMKNAKGVCLMRLGQFDEALRLYRNLVLQSGTMWMRPDVPVTWKVNFCTALLLAGHSAGCAASLAEINRNAHPAVVKLREAIADWKRGLSLWERFLWWIGQEPQHPVTLKFPPGELDDDRPEEPRPPVDRREAA